MGNSHGANVATAGRLAAVAGAPHPASTASATTTAVTEAQRALRTAERAHTQAQRAADRAHASHQAAFDEMQRLRAEHTQAATGSGGRDADVDAALRQARQTAPAAAQRVDAARAETRRATEEHQRALRDGQDIWRRANEHPEDAAAQRAARRMERQYMRASTATGRAYMELSRAEAALTRAVTGQAPLATRLVRAEAAATRAQARTIQADDAARVARQAVRDAQVQLNLARGGSGVLPHGDASERAGLAAASTLFGRVMSVDDFARMVGARPGEEVTISGAGGRAGRVELRYRGAERDTRLSISRGSGANGRLTAHVEWAGTNKGSRTAASGRELLRSMQTMHQYGIERVTAIAGGSAQFPGGMNGYYTWARMGFTGAIPGGVRRAAQRRFGAGVTRVEQVMREPGGPQWWKTHGEQFNATFDWSNAYSANRFTELSATVNRASAAGG